MSDSVADASRLARGLAVLAKAPVPGRVNTRMMPDLTAEQAAELQAVFLADILARAFPVDRRVLWTTGGAATQWSEATEAGWLLEEQPSGDLGERMCAAIDEGLGAAERVLVLGTDAPDLPSELLEAAFVALDSADAVVVPATDGGYVAIGARRAVPGLFAEIDWGTSRVIESTRRRAADAELVVVELSPWPDVDNVADLRRLALDSRERRRGHLPHRANSTLALIHRLGVDRGSDSGADPDESTADGNEFRGHAADSSGVPAR